MATPSSQIIDGYVNITATVSDNCGLNTVKINITGPTGFSTINTTMTPHGANLYYYNDNYSLIGTYEYYIWAEDTHSNSDISATYQFDIVGEIQITNMTYGWMFVSLPFNQTVEKSNLFVIYNGSEYNWSEAVTQGIVLNFIYGWIPETQSYNSSTTALEPGQGYWMFCYNTCELWATGLSALSFDNYITEMAEEWIIVGLPNDIVVNKSQLLVYHNGTQYNWSEAVTQGIVLNFIYDWNRTTQTYESDSTALEPGRAYWMYAFDECILKWEVI
jgi:hypothetical protein